MSDQAPSNSSPVKVFLGAMGVFVFFGFLVLILSGYAGHESIEDRAYMGEFDAETIAQRWANLDDVEAAQAELLDEEKVESAMLALSKEAPKASESAVVVPGSPTFMKQMEAASAPAPAKTEEAAPESKKDETKAEAAAPEPKNDKAKPEPKAKAVAPETKKEKAKPEPKAEAAAPEKPSPKKKEEVKPTVAPEKKPVAEKPAQ